MTQEKKDARTRNRERRALFTPIECQSGGACPASASVQPYKRAFYDLFEEFEGVGSAESMLWEMYTGYTEFRNSSPDDRFHTARLFKHLLDIIQLGENMRLELEHMLDE